MRHRRRELRNHSATKADSQLTTNSEFEQVPFNAYPPTPDLERELDQLRGELDVADWYISELQRERLNAYIRAYSAESLLDDQESELIRLRRLASRSWKELLHEEVVAAGKRVLSRLRQR
jgi:hypothetical protein